MAHLKAQNARASAQTRRLNDRHLCWLFARTGVWSRAPSRGPPPSRTERCHSRRILSRRTFPRFRKRSAPTNVGGYNVKTRSNRSALTTGSRLVIGAGRDGGV